MNKQAVFKSWWVPILFALPQLLLILFFFYWPVASVLRWAFTLEPPFGGPAEFVGFDNFRDVFSDGEYWRSVGISVTFTIIATTLSMGSALVLATAVDRQLKGSGIFQFFYIWPYAIAAPAVGIAFQFIFAPETGLVGFLNVWWPGIWNPATNGTHALILVIISYAWITIGYNFIFLVAGLQSIPKSLIEAAAMDGSGPLRRIIDVQIPLLAPTLFLVLVLDLTDAFVGANTYGIVDRVTEGGPNNSTNVMVYRIVQEAFKGLNYSGAAAQSLVLIGLIMIFTFIQFRFVERQVHYK
jgi:sn-glycerol 3-phosphate transport system permease protein